MVRQKMPDGSWRDLSPAVEEPAPFARRDGTVMSQDEIAAAAQVDVDAAYRTLPAAARRHGPAPKVRPDAAWAAYLEARSVPLAAQRLGIGESTCWAHLRAYMTSRGLEGRPSDHLPRAEKPTVPAAAPAEPLIEPAQSNGHHRFAGLEELAHATALEAHASPEADNPSTSAPTAAFGPHEPPASPTEANDDPRFVVVDRDTLLELLERTDPPVGVQLRRSQAVLVLAAILPGTNAAARLLDALERHGFGFTIHLLEEDAA